MGFAGLVGKKKRAPSNHIANIAYSDLVKYFDMPIVEASRRLNVGLTVLKKKCREFGIPRWPHRKIKSLDSLIHDLQVLFTLPSMLSWLYHSLCQATSWTNIYLNIRVNLKCMQPTPWTNITIWNMMREWVVTYFKSAWLNTWFTLKYCP